MCQYRIVHGKSPSNNGRQICVHHKTIEIPNDHDFEKNSHITVRYIWILAMANVNYVFFNLEEIPKVPNACRFKPLPHHGFFLINVPLPTAGLFYFNYKIYRAAKNQNEWIKSESRTSQSQAQKASQNAKRKKRVQQMKLVKTFAIVLGVFIVCLLPILNVVYSNVCNL